MQQRRRCAHWFILFFFLLGISATPLRGNAQEIVVDDFKNGLSPRWKKQVFHGETEYKVVTKDGRRCIQAESRDTASALYYKTDFDVEQYPFLEWSWKISNILKKEDVTRKQGDDFAARVYVVFPAWPFWRSRTLAYVCASKMGRGQVAPSPFTDNAKIIAVESGPQNVGKWLVECRNLYEDFLRYFGEKPPKAGGVAIMSDTDNTGESVTAWYGLIRIRQSLGSHETNHCEAQ